MARGESFHVPVEVAPHFPEKGSTGVIIETELHGTCQHIGEANDIYLEFTL
jgi:hypothetical protein